MFCIRQHAFALAFQKIADRGFQARVPQVMPGTCDDRLKAADQLVLTLGPRIEALNTVGDGVLHPLVKTRFEVQAIELGQAAPVAAIQAVASQQTERHGHR